MKRKYLFLPHHIYINPLYYLELAKKEYLKKYSKNIKGPNRDKPFNFCIIYLVIGKDNSLQLEFTFPKGLKAKSIAKSPYGFEKTGDILYNTDIREFVKFEIPPHNEKLYFDFILFALDITTQEYWATNLWIGRICTDLRYYLSKKRKNEYNVVGKSIAEGYNRTFLFGVKSGKLKYSKGVKRLIRNGWIPTLFMFPYPYIEMIRIIMNTNDISKVNSFVEKFWNDKLIDKAFERWLKASLVFGREELLKRSINHFKSGDFISFVYLIMPQIEGLITKHIIRMGENPKEHFEDRFIQFGEIIKAQDYNTKTTCYLTKILISYLKNTFFKKWYPFKKISAYTGKTKVFKKSTLVPQRHILLHGEINLEYFSRVNCLKLISIIDSIILLSLTKKELHKPKT